MDPLEQENEMTAMVGDTRAPCVLYCIVLDS